MEVSLYIINYACNYKIYSKYWIGYTQSLLFLLLLLLEFNLLKIRE